MSSIAAPGLNVDRLNILLIVLAFFAALFKPYETFVLAYAYLGPLHYLTQISWLHDRKYFLSQRKEVLFLLVPGTIWMLSILKIVPLSQQASAGLVWLIIVAAISCVVGRTLKERLILALGLSFVGLLLTTKSWWLIVILTLLPTLIHVFFFTGIFMLFGAMKSKSVAGVVAVITLFALGALILLIPAPDQIAPVSPYFDEGASFFRSLQTAVVSILGLSNNDGSMFRAMRFIGFAYLYHYLNWFSKTKVIGWGEISRERLILIVTLYALMVTIYYMNFTVGFIAALTLSIAHVFLEFPLNVQSVRGVARGLWKPAPAK